MDGPAIAWSFTMLGASFADENSGELAEKQRLSIVAKETDLRRPRMANVKSFRFKIDHGES